MRVVGGVARGRPLVAPSGRSTRPTSDRVREAVFSMLESIGAVEQKTFLDLYAGSGGLGIEALSRGASAVTFVERERAAVSAIRRNLEMVGDAPGKPAVVTADVLAYLRRGRDTQVDVVLADPPYPSESWGELLELLEGRTGLLVAETSGPLTVGGGWETVKTRQYGSTVVTLIRVRAAPRAEGGL